MLAKAEIKAASGRRVGKIERDGNRGLESYEKSIHDKLCAITSLLLDGPVGPVAIQSIKKALAISVCFALCFWVAKVRFGNYANKT